VEKRRINCSFHCEKDGKPNKNRKLFITGRYGSGFILSRDRLSIFGFQLFLVTLTTVTRADVVASADIGSVAGVRRVSGGSPLD
jgi:hypothetical protein